jgi:GDP-L-fucose synthase
MKILISGCCGFVGRRFARRLVAEGNLVVGVDNLVEGLPPERWAFPVSKPDRLLFHLKDIRQYFSVVKSHEFDLVIHCAAIVGGRRVLDGDPLAVATDMSIDAELFNWIVRGKHMPKLIYFSSSAVYPAELQTRANHVALSESLVNFDGTRIGLPELTYGFAKLAGEYLAKCAVEKYGLDVKIYRPFGGYGEDQSLDYPVPSIVKRVLDREDPVTVWGSGEQQRDFIYIEDVVDAVLATMNRLKPGEVLNLGSGVGTTFFQVALAVMVHALGGRIVGDETKPEGVFYRVADTSKLNQWYKPTTSFRDGIAKVAAHLGLDKAKARV